LAADHQRLWAYALLSFLKNFPFLPIEWHKSWNCTVSFWKAVGGCLALFKRQREAILEAGRRSGWGRLIDFKMKDRKSLVTPYFYVITYYSCRPILKKSFRLSFQMDDRLSYERIVLELAVWQNTFLKCWHQWVSKSPRGVSLLPIATTYKVQTQLTLYSLYTRIHEQYRM
jgi:hypothetical protein